MHIQKNIHKTKDTRHSTQKIYLLKYILLYFRQLVSYENKMVAMTAKVAQILCTHEQDTKYQEKHKKNFFSQAFH